ncbi:MAG TPA: hypothetical protein VJV97_10465 [Gemmatimonadaceae bacterium]|nr:hypothetical protein [Gemmatimonadaceae bacterium]
MDQPETESPAARSGSGYLTGAAILVALNGLLSALRTRTPARAASYTTGAFFGGVLVFALVGLVVYGVARAIGKTKPASTAAKIVFWILLVLLLLNGAGFVARAVNPRSASAQAVFTKEDRQG